MKSAQPNNIMERIKAKFVGSAVLKDYALYDLPYGFPCVVPNRGSAVRGEAYQTDSEEAIEMLDRYEGVGNLYIRNEETIEIEINKKKVKAFVYVWNKSLPEDAAYIPFERTPWKPRKLKGAMR